MVAFSLWWDIDRYYDVGSIRLAYLRAGTGAVEVKFMIDLEVLCFVIKIRDMVVFRVIIFY